MHKNPYKHGFIAGSARWSTKHLSILLTKLLTHIKHGLQKYCETACSRSGVNQMWILKNSKELLEHLKSPNFNHITSIKSFDFSFNPLYNYLSRWTENRLASIIWNSLIFKNGNRRYKYLVLGHEEEYFVKEYADSKNTYSRVYVNDLPIHVCNQKSRQHSRLERQFRERNIVGSSPAVGKNFFIV